MNEPWAALTFLQRRLPATMGASTMGLQEGTSGLGSMLSPPHRGCGRGPRGRGVCSAPHTGAVEGDHGVGECAQPPTLGLQEGTSVGGVCSAPDTGAVGGDLSEEVCSAPQPWGCGMGPWWG